MTQIDDMDEEERETAYRSWWDATKAHRKRFPLKRIRMIDTVELAKELQKGGVTLSPDHISTLVRHRDKFIIVEVPWEIAATFPLSDLATHASYLLARMRTHSPKRVRFVRDKPPHDFTIQVVE